MPDQIASAPPAAKRPWYRLHRSTVTVAVIGLVVGIFTILPGEPGWYPERFSRLAERAVIHGWPAKFLWRTPRDWKNNSADTDSLLAWQLGDHVREFRAGALLLDLTIAIAAFAALVAGMESLSRWHRRRNVRWPVIAAEIGAVLIVGGAVIAWWALRHVDEELDTVISATPHERLKTVPRLPLWLRLAVGDEKLSSLHVNAPREGTRALWHSNSAKANAATIYLATHYPQQTVLVVFDGLSEADGKAIADITPLENLEFESSEPTDLPQALNASEHLPNLVELDLSVSRDFRGGESISDADVARLAKLPRLERFSTVAKKLTEKGYAELGKLNQLRELHLWNAWLSKASCSHIAALSRVERLDLGGSVIFQADLGELGRIDSLEELDLRYANLLDDGAKQLRALKHLKYLNLESTHITGAGLAAMLEPSPDNSHPLESLQFLSLESDAIVGADFKPLASLSSLKTLIVETNQINDETIAALQKLPALRHLHAVGSKGLSNAPEIEQRLKHALPSCETSIDL